MRGWRSKVAAHAQLQGMSLVVAVSNFDTAATEVLQTAIQRVRTDLGNIQLVNPKTGGLDMIVHHGFGEEFRKFFATVGRDDPTAWGALRAGKRVVIENVEQGEGFAPYRNIADKAGHRAVQSPHC